MTKFFVPVFLLISLALSAQYAETILSGRPGQAIGPRAVGAKVFQIQSGVNNNVFSLDELQQNTFSTTTVFRLGAFEKLEISSLITWQQDHFNKASNMDDIMGISNTQIGLRYNITQNKGWIPALGIQGRLLLKMQSDAYRRDELGSRFIFVTTNKITNWLSLTSNWALTFTGNDSETYEYIINFSSGITDQFSVFAEVFGSLSTTNNNFDTGIAYLLNDDLQLDISSGFLFDGQGDNWFIDAGISWRFDWRDKVE